MSLEEVYKFLINLMSIFIKAVGGNWSNWRNPTQAEEEDVHTKLSEISLNFGQSFSVWSEQASSPASP